MVIIFFVNGHMTLLFGKTYTLPPPHPHPLAPGYWMIPFGLLTGKQTWLVFTLVHAFSLFSFFYLVFTQSFGLRKGETKQQKDVGAGLFPPRLRPMVSDSS